MPYIGNQPGTGVRSRFIYTATASQTTFTGADDNSKTLKYADSDYIDVYLNGVCLVPVTDYTASTKTSVVLTQAASVSDTLEVVAYDIATISDTVSKADGGQFDGAVTVEADFTVDSNTLHVDSANNKVGILDDEPDGALHVYNGMLQVGSKDGDTSIQQNANAIRIAAVPNTSTEWGGLQWYREFSNYIGAEIIAARASAAEAETDLIIKTSSSAANAGERMRIGHNGAIYQQLAGAGGFQTGEISFGHIGNDASGTGDIKFFVDFTNTTGTYDTFIIMLYLAHAGNSSPIESAVYRVQGYQRSSALSGLATSLIDGSSRPLTVSSSGLTLTITVGSEGSSTNTQGGLCRVVAGRYGFTELRAST